MTVFDIAIIGSGEAALCAAGAAARSGAATALVQSKSVRRPSTASICNIPNFVWRRLDLHEYGFSLTPVSARITLLEDGAVVTTHNGEGETENALEIAKSKDSLVWSDFLTEIRALDEALDINGADVGRQLRRSLLSCLDGDEDQLSALEQHTMNVVSLLDDFLEDDALKAHLVAHALAPSGLGGGEAGTVAGLSEFMSEEAWRVRVENGAKAVFQALEDVCKNSGVTIFDSAFKGVTNGSGKSQLIQLADGETIKTKAILFASPDAALAAGFRAPLSPMAGHGGAQAQLRIQLKSPMEPPEGNRHAIFQILDKASDLQAASNAAVSGRLPESLPIEFEFADNGDLLARTSYCPRAFKEEDGWREWTGQDRQAVTRLMTNQLSSRLGGLSDNIKKTSVKIMGPLSLDTPVNTDRAENIYIQPSAHNAVASAVRLVDKVLGI
ncbi:MAG: hypothetical protein DHS20C05_18400 [Hyphococcus sp.]|nr:MAG: hypothetical protein DHS20C05_18400 [Marinicaulis sp.]